MADVSEAQDSMTELVQRAQQGDFGAFEELVRTHQDRIYRLVYQMVRSDADAEEVMQEAFLSAYRGLERFQGQSSFATWLYRIASNAALMKLRTKRRKPLFSLEELSGGKDDHVANTALWPSGVWSRLPEDQALRNELKERIHNQVAALPEKYRTVLLLRDVEGMSNEEAAEALGLTVASVKSRLHRARLVIRQALGEYFTS